MTFCREFHLSPLEYRRQPARTIVRWRQMLAAEREGIAMAKRIAQARAKARGRGN